MPRKADDYSKSTIQRRKVRVFPNNDDTFQDYTLF